MERVIMVNHLDLRRSKYPTYWVGSYDEDKEEIRRRIATANMRGISWLKAQYSFVHNNEDYYRAWGPRERPVWGMMLITEAENNEWGECSP